MMDDEITVEGVAALLTQLAAVQMERDEERARADELAGDLSELRENVLLGLGMTAEAVASMDADMMEPSIAYLLAGHEALAAEVERLTAEKRGYRDDWLIERELAQLNIEYDGGDPLQRLVEEVAALRAQLEAAEAERDDANAEAATDQRHAMESGAENLSLRAQLEALQNALDDAQLLADERGEELARGAGEGWRAVTVDWPPSSKSLPVLLRNGSARWGYRANGLWHLTGGKFAADAVTHAYVMRPAPPQE